MNIIRMKSIIRKKYHLVFRDLNECCFLDIFLVLEFPLLSVYFFLQTSMIAVLSHTYKEKRERERKDKKHLLLKSQTYQELSLGSVVSTLAHWLPVGPWGSGSQGRR